MSWRPTGGPFDPAPQAVGPGYRISTSIRVPAPALPTRHSRIGRVALVEISRPTVIDASMTACQIGEHVRTTPVGAAKLARRHEVDSRGRRRPKHAGRLRGSEVAIAPILPGSGRRETHRVGGGRPMADREGGRRTGARGAGGFHTSRGVRAPLRSFIGFWSPIEARSENGKSPARAEDRLPRTSPISPTVLAGRCRGQARQVVTFSAFTMPIERRKRTAPSSGTSTPPN